MPLTMKTSIRPILVGFGITGRIVPILPTIVNGTEVIEVVTACQRIQSKHRSVIF